jgi:ArsR family transcriptional regulator
MLRIFKADLFKALAHPIRIQILEVLRPGELTVTELQAHLDIDMSSVSQQLAILRSRQLVTSRKEGTSAYYRVADPEVYVILDVARKIFERHVVALQALADEK